MDRRKLTSAVVIHAGAALVAVMALGSQGPETTSRQEEVAPASRVPNGRTKVIVLPVVERETQVLDSVPPEQPSRIVNASFVH